MQSYKNAVQTEAAAAIVRKSSKSANKLQIVASKEGTVSWGGIRGQIVASLQGDTAVNVAWHSRVTLPCGFSVAHLQT